MIIAECSQNFTNLAEATGLINLAKLNGADLCKFQLFDSQKLYGKKVPAELSFKQAKDLFDYGKAIGIEVFFSVFGVERVKWCEEIGVKRYKVAYSQRYNEDLIDSLPPRKTIYISVERADDQYFGKWGDISKHLTFDALYCVPKYPAELSDLDFNARDDSWDSTNTFDLIGGFSDHCVGLDASKIALARGAEIIEKHFAIDHQTGIDAEWSMTPSELQELKRWETVCKEAL